MAISRLRRRLSRNSDEGTNAIGASDAWWSERDHVERVPKPKKRGRDAVVAEPEPEQARQVDHEFSAIPEPEPGAGPAEPQVDENHPNWAFATLDLEPGCSWDEVRSRHKALAKDHHPDMVARLFPEVAATAADEMTQINRAYSELKRIYRSRSVPEGAPDDSAQ